MTRRTKIVATIGPASSSPAALRELIEAGIDVARLNLSHGKVEDHLGHVPVIRRIAQECGRVVAVLADLPGPKVRTTSMGEGVAFADGAAIELQTGAEPSTAGRIFTDYPTLARDVKPDDEITLGDGGVSLRVTAVKGEVVQAEVVVGGFLRSRPGLHLPANRMSLPVPTDEDREFIPACLAAEVDFIAVSFVRTAADLRTVRELVGPNGPKLVAKVETPAAIDNLDEIVEEADVVMVARGDLGTECPLEDVPVYQKRIIRACLSRAVPVITATQMLESMITAATPTRAEASDVANAVCDGTDAIMLSAETAVGHNPPLVVRTMARIAERAEAVADYGRFSRAGSERRIDGLTAALTHAAWQAATDAGATAILCCTRSGATAHAMAMLRPEQSLIAVSPSSMTVRQEALTWGMHAVAIPISPDTDVMVNDAIEIAKNSSLLKSGDVVAVLAGAPGVTGSTNVLRLLKVQ